MTLHPAPHPPGGPVAGAVGVRGCGELSESATGDELETWPGDPLPHNGVAILGPYEKICDDHMVEGPFTVPNYVPEGLTQLVRAAQRADQRHPQWRSYVPRSQTSSVIAEAEPGPSLAGLLTAETEGRSLPVRDEGTVLELIAACDRMMNHYAAVQLQFARELLDRRRESLQSMDCVGDEIAVRLGVTGYAGGAIVARAKALEDAMDVSAALASGVISPRKVDLITSATAGRPDDQVETLEEYALDIAPTHTPTQLRKKLAEALQVIDPETAEERHEAERKQRYVSCRPAEHGMGWLGVYGPAEDIAAAFTCLDTMAADRAEDDERGIDARRADAFGQIFREILADGVTRAGHPLPVRQGVPGHVGLTVTAPVLAGDGHTPALLHGYGPITAGAARRLIGATGLRGGSDRASGRGPDCDQRTSISAITNSRTDDGSADSSAFALPYPGAAACLTPALEPSLGPLPEAIRRDRLNQYCPPAWPADLPDGTDRYALLRWAGAQRAAPRHECALLESRLGLLATDSYLPSRRLRRRIVDRDQTCRFPTCQAPGWRCQIDHIVAFSPDLPAWAQTVETNLHLLCAHHHQLKTAGLFRVERDVRTGSTTWRSPTGHVYIRAGEPADLAALEFHLRDDVTLSWFRRPPPTAVERARREVLRDQAGEASAYPVHWENPTGPAVSERQPAPQPAAPEPAAPGPAASMEAPPF